MHGIVPASKRFPRSNAPVTVLSPKQKNAWARVQNGSDALLSHGLAEPVYELGTMFVCQDGVFFKRKRKVHQLIGVRFDSEYHKQNVSCKVLLTRQGHEKNVVIVLRCDTEPFNAINRVPGSRFVVYHMMKNLPCRFVKDGGLGTGAQLVFSRRTRDVVILDCPPFRSCWYDKSRFSIVDATNNVICGVKGRRYHMKDKRTYYLDKDDRILCPTFTE